MAYRRTCGVQKETETLGRIVWRESSWMRRASMFSSVSCHWQDKWGCVVVVVRCHSVLTFEPEIPSHSQQCIQSNDLVLQRICGFDDTVSRRALDTLVDKAAREGKGEEKREYNGG